MRRNSPEAVCSSRKSVRPEEQPRVFGVSLTPTCGPRVDGSARPVAPTVLDQSISLHPRICFRTSGQRTSAGQSVNTTSPCSVNAMEILCDSESSCHSPVRLTLEDSGSGTHAGPPGKNAKAPFNTITATTRPIRNWIAPTRMATRATPRRRIHSPSRGRLEATTWISLRPHPGRGRHHRAGRRSRRRQSSAGDRAK